MSNNKEIVDLCNQYVMNTYNRSVPIVKGQGCRVWDANGMQYYDFTSGIAVQNVGHAHPQVVEAVKNQMETLNHCSNLFYNEQQGLLAKKLAEISGLGGKSFFCNSGAEANEALIKLARLWGKDEGRFEIITFLNSFHGRTLATCAATGQSKIQEGFDPLPLGFEYAVYNDIDSVKAKVGQHTVAVLIECVQGEGGVIPVDPEFMKQLRALCDEKNLLLLCDEVQCGMGRTGDWFAWQGTGVKPDAFSVAKALASGIPMGAVVASPKLSDVFTPGKHGSTFGGNPLACAAALATIDVIESEGLLARAKEVGAAFRDGLMQFVAKYDKVLDVRGKGLMLGLVLDGVPAKKLIDICRGMGLLVCAAGESVVRFLPPLNVKEEDLEEALDYLDEAFETLFEDEEAEEAK